MPATRVDLYRINPILLSTAAKTKEAQKQSTKKFQAIARGNYVEMKEITEPAQKNTGKFSTIKAADDSGSIHCDYVFSMMITGMMC